MENNKKAGRRTSRLFRSFIFCSNVTSAIGEILIVSFTRDEMLYAVQGYYSAKKRCRRALMLFSESPQAGDDHAQGSFFNDCGTFLPPGRSQAAA
jgi:hypothetical protein